ncbi:hypothetical protein D9M71_539670 [compost metagenome]|jgi:antitoxin component of MazEF toxin-antitoxin module
MADFGASMSTRFRITIEDWDGDGAVRIPDQALQELGVDVGDSLYLIEEFVGTSRCLVLSKTPKIPDRVDELFGV